MTSTFAQLGLPKSLVGALAKRGFTDPFPIQTAAIPDVLAGRDISAKAPTGSGKTLAFGLPVLASVGKGKRNRPRALILAPTRELAEQIKQELTPLAKAVDRRIFAIYGGVAYGAQRSAMRQGVDVLVATPGRLEDLMEQGTVRLDDVDVSVIDEADRMADMGFLPAVRRILDAATERKQMLLFSATLDGDVAALTRRYQHTPVRHEAEAMGSDVSDASHHFWLVSHSDRTRHAADLVGVSGRSILFTRTRRGADRLTRDIAKLGISAVALHGGRSQGQRRKALSAFASGKAEALVATDVAARGIHIDAVASVIHFDPPADAKDYIHRSGRTARAGAAGKVISLVTHEQKRAVRRIQLSIDLETPIEAPRLDAISQSAAGSPRGAHNRSGSATAHRKARHERSRSRSTSQRDRHEPAHRAGSLYVANLPWATTADDLRKLFGPYGRVAEATIISNRRTGRSKGFGFVDMSASAAHAAIKGLHGKTFRGRDLTVRAARPQRAQA